MFLAVFGLADHKDVCVCVCVCVCWMRSKVCEVRHTLPGLALECTASVSSATEKEKQ